MKTLALILVVLSGCSIDNPDCSQADYNTLWGICFFKYQDKFPQEEVEAFLEKFIQSFEENTDFHMEKADYMAVFSDVEMSISIIPVEDWDAGGSKGYMSWGAENGDMRVWISLCNRDGLTSIRNKTLVHEMLHLMQYVYGFDYQHHSTVTDGIEWFYDYEDVNNQDGITQRELEWVITYAIDGQW